MAEAAEEVPLDVSGSCWGTETADTSSVSPPDSGVISSHSPISSSETSSSAAASFRLDPTCRPFSPRSRSAEPPGNIRESSLNRDDYGLRGLVWARRRALAIAREQENDDDDDDFPGRGTDSGVESVLNDDDSVPPEYRHSAALDSRLLRPSSQYWPTDLLFFFFYTCTGDALQILAGYHLFNRGWRYNKISKVWVARLSGVPPQMRVTTYERGMYQYFDVSTWKREKCQTTLNYSELAEQIALPPEIKAMYEPVDARTPQPRSHAKQQTVLLQQQLQQQQLLQHPSSTVFYPQAYQRYGKEVLQQPSQSSLTNTLWAVRRHPATVSYSGVYYY